MKIELKIYFLKWRGHFLEVQSFREAGRVRVHCEGLQSG